MLEARRSAMLIWLLLSGIAHAQSNAFKDPYVSVSKGARTKPLESASLPAPVPERFGPVVLSPAPTDFMTTDPLSDSAKSNPTFAAPVEKAKAQEPPCEITSYLSGTAAKGLIAKIAAEEEFDLTLLNAIAKQESDFRMDQRSPAGALGLMQLMPATAKSLAVNPCDPEQNIRGAIKLLRLLEAKYSGNIIYMLAAYNAGEDAVDRNSGIPPYRETITYVTRILSDLNGWQLPSRSKSDSTARSLDNPSNNDVKPAANRWAQGFVLHVE